MHSLAIGMAIFLALVFIAIGIYYVVSPMAAMRSFGLPLPDAGPNTAWWLRLKGVRDGVSGLLILVLIARENAHVVGTAMLVLATIPIGDMLLILSAKGSSRSAFAMHAPTALIMALTALPLLAGGL